jgi:hypothetical protein
MSTILYRVVVAILILFAVIRLSFDVSDFYSACHTDTECGCTDDCLEPAK